MGHVLPVAVMLADVGATSGRRLHYERQPFTLQKTVFYIAKGYLSEDKRRSFAPLLDVSGGMFPTLQGVFPVNAS